ncbi:hypothetical protein [Reinekea blandensis]|uniref:Autotransporter adhesin n=1 Tax=Reinekea blandensis MED297 TaxID=314283 RepID=A4BHY3_9GAMM|nr:hypothetical protein [Reinekea blandensis]EAR08255.1 Autotransporter adhesin [Reinekea sp. MED297] [Reinekea blandensis MED297]
MPFFSNLLKPLVLVTVGISMGLLSCVSSTGGEKSNPDAKTLTLIDSPVNGIRYHCDGREGMTEQGGKLYCEKAPIGFFLGEMAIGTLAEFPEDLNVYLQDLIGVPREQYDHDDVVNLGRLLQSLDDDGVIAEVIDIPVDTAVEFIASDSLDDGLKALAEIANVDLVSEPFAIAHLKRSYEGGEDASFYQITIVVDDADAGTLLIPAAIELTFFGAEIIDSTGEAVKSIQLSDTLKRETFFLRNPPQEGQVLKVQAKAEGYIDTGTTALLNAATGGYELELNMLKDQAGYVANGVMVSKEDVSAKVAAGTVTSDITATATPYFGQPGGSVEIPAGVYMTDADGNAIDGAEITFATLNLRQDEARTSLPDFNNSIDNLGDLISDGIISEAESLDVVPLTYTTVNITDNQGDKVKRFSSDIEITLQLAVGSGDVAGNVFQPGDLLPIFSYDESSGKIQYEQQAVVEDLNPSDGMYDVRVQTNHLTAYGVAQWYDDHLQTCEHPGTIVHYKDKYSGDYVKMWDVYEGTGYVSIFPNYEVSVLSVHASRPSIYLADHKSFYGVSHSPPPGTTKESSHFFIQGWGAFTYIFSVYNKAGALVGYKEIADVCSGETYEVLIDTDDSYGYEEAREKLDALSSASAPEKEEGIASHVGALQAVHNVSVSLTNAEDERGEELLDDSRDIVLEYAEAFFENNNAALADLAGSSINDLGCMSGLMEAYKEELNQNLSAYLAMGGEDYSIPELLKPLLEQVAEEYIDFEPLYIYAVDDSLKEYVDCGWTLIAALSSVNYEAVNGNLIAGIQEAFEPTVLANVSAIRGRVDDELNAGGGTDDGGSDPMVTAYTAAIFENILNVAESLANELMPLTHFSNAGLSQIQSQQAYLDALEALGQIEAP